MKKFLLFGILLALLFWQHPEWLTRIPYLNLFSEKLAALYPAATKNSSTTPANAAAVLFVFDGCGNPCNEATHFLSERGIAHERINLSEGDAAVTRLHDAGWGNSAPMPLLTLADQHLEGFQRYDWLGFFAENSGPHILTDFERQLMTPHFDATGKPLRVMYATRHCGYCQLAREYFSNNKQPFVERDIELDASAAASFQALEGNGTPLIYYGYKRIEGFNAGALAGL